MTLDFPCPQAPRVSVIIVAKSKLDLLRACLQSVARFAPGVIPFETQLPFVMVAFVVVFGWLLGADFAAHRSRTLPRPLTRVGLLLGAGFVVGMLLAAAGLLLRGPAGQVVLWLGLGVGSVAWLALPAFPLLLARYVFTKERS